MEKKDDDRTNGRWTKAEHELFLLGLQIHGKNWKKIETMIGTRNGSQIRSHAQKFFLKVQGKNNQHCDQLHKSSSQATVEGMHGESSNLSVEEKDIQNVENETDISFFSLHLNKYSREHQQHGETKELNLFNFWEQCIEIRKNDKIKIEKNIGQQNSADGKTGEDQEELSLSKKRSSFVLCGGSDSDKLERLTKLIKLN